MKKKVIARVVNWRAAEEHRNFAALWSAAMWLAALIYLLATLDVMH